MYYLADLPAEWFHLKIIPTINKFVSNIKAFLANKKQFITNNLTLSSMADNGSRGPPDLI